MDLSSLEFLPIPDAPKELNSKSESSGGGITVMPKRSRAEMSTAESRELTLDEILTLKPLFESYGVPLPDPAVSVFLGVVDKGAVQGFLVLQWRYHAEPMQMNPGYESHVRSLMHLAEKKIQSMVKATDGVDVYVFAPVDNNTAGLAKTCGMEVEPWVVLTKHINPLPEEKEKEDKVQ